ncbi:WD repeat-containing protein 49-like [Suncus etruscus]|uniref:WD repeat-containing protein 49-like n=1 Tax=Suncus etruscus TaxID=109475 RepID=UPI00211020F0|nr:WD repeat-containing protein 49-like [Suncus etruscus]
MWFSGQALALQAWSYYFQNKYGLTSLSTDLQALRFRRLRSTTIPIITVHESMAVRSWKKLPKVENIPNISIHNAVISPNVNYVCWKVHRDWVTQLNYYDSIKAGHFQAATMSPPLLGHSIGAEGQSEVTVYKIQPAVNETHSVGPGMFGNNQGYKQRRKNLLLTGGMDRIIRVWNPYLPGKPIGMLKSHTAPLVYIHASAEDNKIFSMSTDNMVKIWDLDTHSCLFLLPPKPAGLQAAGHTCLYLPHPRALCVATKAVALLHLKLRSPPEPDQMVSHREPVLCCQYNSVFRHVISCSEASVVKVWDFETGRLSTEFIGAHDNSGITCMALDSSGRRLITGGRDGRLKIWSYNNGHCLHTLEHDEKHCEVCDCVYLEVNQNKCFIAVGWDRRINVYFDLPRDFHHFWKPQPYWQDDLNQGHKEDIFCVTHCPPCLLATSSYDGEIIVWNVNSGHVYCKLNTPSLSDGAEEGEGSDRSVSCLIFLKTRVTTGDRTAGASLMANGPGGSLTFWRLSNGTSALANFTPSKSKAQVSSITVSAEDAFTYVADQDGFVHVYDIQEYALWGAELQPPKNVTFWRAHISTVTSLELVEEKFLLSASLDHTVRLWSITGEYIGTFGQSNSWDIFTPDSWSHPRVPCEILTAPKSKPIEPVLVEDPPVCTGKENGEKIMQGKSRATFEKISNLPEDATVMVEAERKEDPYSHHLPTSSYSGRTTSSKSENREWKHRENGDECTITHPHSLCKRTHPHYVQVEGSLLKQVLLEWNRPSPRASEPTWPSIYQTLQCHELACVSTLREKPNLSVIDSDVFSFNILTQEKEESETTRTES